MMRRLTVITGLTVAGTGLCGLPLVPESSGVIKAAWLGCLVIVWVAVGVFLWRRGKRWGLAAVMGLPVAVAAPFFLPGGEIEAGELRGEYVRRLRGYEGTRYVWGGENGLGIDCSGLPRRAFRDALLAYGFRHGNGRAFRAWGEQWWYDASARALGEGYRGYTRKLPTEGKIREMDYAGLAPGDLAVTRDGTHMLAYAGEDRWIQADPGAGAVVTLDGRTDGNAWFRAPVTTHRWSALAGK